MLLRIYINHYSSDTSRFLLADAPNPLLVPLESSVVSKARRTQLWFSRAGLQGILGGDQGEEEEEEEERAVRVFQEKGGQLWDKEGQEGGDNKKGEM